MRVLILGGGGTLGAFSAGALRVLEERGWVPDALIGSSAGAINLMRSLVGGSAAAAAFWQSLRWPELLWEGLRHNIFVRGLLDPVRFTARVNAGVDFETLLHERRYVGFIVVDMSNGKVAVRGNRTEKDADSLRRIANASYALPPLLPPVRGADGHLYADGGLLQNAPLESALALGATEIVYLCNVQVVPRQGFERASTPRSTLRYLEIFARRASNVGFADAEIVEGAFRGVPFLTIAPPESVRLDSMLSWMLPSPHSMERLVASGYANASSAVAQASWLHLPSSPPASRPPRALYPPALSIPRRAELSALYGISDRTTRSFLTIRTRFVTHCIRESHSGLLFVCIAAHAAWRLQPTGLPKRTVRGCVRRLVGLISYSKYPESAYFMKSFRISSALITAALVSFANVALAAPPASQPSYASPTSHTTTVRILHDARPVHEAHSARAANESNLHRWLRTPTSEGASRVLTRDTKIITPHTSPEAFYRGPSSDPASVAPAPAPAAAPPSTPEAAPPATPSAAGVSSVRELLSGMVVPGDRRATISWEEGMKLGLVGPAKSMGFLDASPKTLDVIVQQMLVPVPNGYNVNGTKRDTGFLAGTTPAEKSLGGPPGLPEQGRITNAVQLPWEHAVKLGIVSDKPSIGFVGKRPEHVTAWVVTNIIRAPEGSTANGQARPVGFAPPAPLASR